MAKKKKYSYIDRVNYYSVKFGKCKAGTGKAFCAGYVDSFYNRNSLSSFSTSAEKEAYRKGYNKSVKALNKAHSLKW